MICLMRRPNRVFLSAQPINRKIILIPQDIISVNPYNDVNINLQIIYAATNTY